MTGQTAFLERARPHIKGAWNYLQEIPRALQDEIRSALIAALNDIAATGRPIATQPSSAVFEQMMETAVGQTVPELYRDVLLEEAQFGGGTGAPWPGASSHPRRSCKASRRW